MEAQFFEKYDWLWKSEKDAEYGLFAAKSPTLDDYEAQLHHFGTIQREVNSVSSIHIIGALSLNTKNLKLHLGQECDKWKFKVRLACSYFCCWCSNKLYELNKYLFLRLTSIPTIYTPKPNENWKR